MLARRVFAPELCVYASAVIEFDLEFTSRFDVGNCIEIHLELIRVLWLDSNLGIPYSFDVARDAIAILKDKNVGNCRNSERQAYHRKPGMWPGEYKITHTIESNV